MSWLCCLKHSWLYSRDRNHRVCQRCPRKQRLSVWEAANGDVETVWVDACAR